MVYVHQELGEDIRSISGAYTPIKELRLDINGRDVLSVIGMAVVTRRRPRYRRWNRSRTTPPGARFPASSGRPRASTTSTSGRLDFKRTFRDSVFVRS